MVRFTSLVIAGCVGATIASQAPEFMQQYKQRLGGAIDELAVVVRHFDQDARASGMDRATALERFNRSGDSFFVQRGASMQATITRWHDMSDHWRALSASHTLSRLPVFISGADRELVKRTWQAYKPAIPTTPEGLIYSGLGFLFSHLFFGAFLSLLRRRPRRIERERYVEDAPVKPRRKVRVS